MEHLEGEMEGVCVSKMWREGVKDMLEKVEKVRASVYRRDICT